MQQIWHVLVGHMQSSALLCVWCTEGVVLLWFATSTALPRGQRVKSGGRLQGAETPPGAELKQDPGLGSPPPADASSVVVGSMLVQH